MAQNKTTRKAVQQQRVLAHVRDRIVRGEYAPGERLPTRRAMSSELGAALVTVDAAMQRLAREGFVEARGSSGTFVVDHPPHLYRYGLVLPNWLSDASRFYHLLVDRAERLAASSDGLQMRLYQFVSWDSAESRRLLRDVRESQVAGLIFAYPPQMGGQKLFVQLLETPMVAVMLKSPHPRVPAVYPDLTEWAYRAVDYVAEQGCRRPAILVGSGQRELFIRPFEERCRERGLASSRYLRQVAVFSDPESAELATELLLQLPDEKRPDALLITDDHFVAGATAGVRRAGRDQLTVVAHRNFPQPLDAGMPVVELGYDGDALIRCCLERIRARRAGRSVPALTRLSPRFTWEPSTSAADLHEILNGRV